MVWSCVALLAIFLGETQSYQPFEVFEIRKSKGNDRNIDYHYYDPDFTRIQSVIQKEKSNNKLIKLAEEITKRFQKLSQKKEDYDESESDTSFVDETRSVIVMPRKDVVYRKISSKENILEKLIQSALRTGNNNVDDRTAAPIHRIPYDYDEK